MAVVPVTKVKQDSLGDIDIRIIEWNGIAQADTCAAYVCEGYPDKNIQIHGTFGGGTIAIHGANHPTSPTFTVVTDAFDTNISGIGAAAHKTIMQHTHSIKPILTGGDGTTDIDVTLLLYIRK